MSSISVVIPILNDAAALERLLGDLGTTHFEVVVVDGGSEDNSAATAGRYGYQVFDSPPNRGLQLNTGARHSAGEWLWLLHADCTVSTAVVDAVVEVANGSPGWGRFDVEFAGASGLLKVVAIAMNNRSWLSGICTGDQGLFVHRSLLEAVGGIPEQPLMEDIELSKRLRRIAKPMRRRETIAPSARRWQRDGVFPTIVRMWWFRLRYCLGANPEALVRDYYSSPDSPERTPDG